MSLDVWLEVDEPITQSPEVYVPIRKDGKTIKITQQEYEQLYPGRSPVVLTEPEESNIVFEYNITHNLGKMARECGLYIAWNYDIKKASELIEPLKAGLAKLVSSPAYYKQFNPANGWGKYEDLVAFGIAYLEACEKYPDAKVGVSA